MNRTYLGEFEEIVLLAVAVMEGQAYAYDTYRIEISWWIFAAIAAWAVNETCVIILYEKEGVSKMRNQRDLSH